MSNEMRFIEDPDHSKLLDYIEADLSPLSDLQVKYCSNKINLETFEPVTTSATDGNELTRISEILAAAHPYYLPKEIVIIDAIIEYFQELLMYSVHTLHNSRLKGLLSEDWYEEQLVNLISPLMHICNGDISAQWRSFKTTYGNVFFNPKEDLKKIWNVAMVSKPVPFKSELRIQKEIANMLYFILDIDADYLKELPTLQRAWIYGTIHPRQTKITSVIDYRGELLDFIDNDEIDKIMDLNASDIIRNSISEDAREQFKRIIEVTRNLPTDPVFSTYEINSIYYLLFIEINEMINSDCRIRRCKNCGRYFVVKNARYIYCNRLVDSERTCRDVGASITYKKHKEEDETLELYDRAYAAHYARYQKSKSKKTPTRKKIKKVMTQIEFFEWAEEAQKMRDAVLNGYISIEEYSAWLKK